MRPFVKHFNGPGRCGHYCKVSSWKAGMRLTCPACRVLDKWWIQNVPSGVFTGEDYQKVRALMFEGVQKLGGYRKPETVVKEIIGDNKELLAEWLLYKGDKAPAFVRAGLEGTKVVKPLSNHAACAKAIKDELRKAYPGLKEIKAKSSSFSGGDSVHVYIRGGYLSDDEKEGIHSIVAKHQYGHFDGMNDIYVYSNRIKGLPQVMFTSVEIEY